MLYSELIEKKECLSVIGLGYVGMPIAVAFAKKISVIGFDTNEARIRSYRQGIDETGEAGDEVIRRSGVYFTADERELRRAKFHIIAVPTPVKQNHIPDLAPVEEATAILGRNLAPGSVVVFESTVYPGVTEDICIPILEKESGLKCGTGFKVGYSPERINPGDREHRLENICKIVSGIDDETLEEVKMVYEMIIDAGTCPVSSIRTAEAIKVVENSQRDINIAFMNELAMVFDRMGIDTKEVIDGMNTKWNALGFRPGLVGGHCIGVDPYYFIYEAERLGYHSQIILAGRKVNDGMGEFVADVAIRQMVLVGKAPKKSKVAIMGLTFKENCSDIRNSKVEDIIVRLSEYGIKPHVADPLASPEAVRQEYGILLEEADQIRGMDCVIFAVAHEEFCLYTWDQIDRFYDTRLLPEEKVLIDVKSVLCREKALQKGYRYWRL